MRPQIYDAYSKAIAGPIAIRQVPLNLSVSDGDIPAKATYLSKILSYIYRIHGNVFYRSQDAGSAIIDPQLVESIYNIKENVPDNWHGRRRNHTAA